MATMTIKIATNNLGRDTLRCANIGPIYSAAYRAAQDLVYNDSDTIADIAARLVDTLNDAQQALAEDYEQMWMSQVQTIAAERHIDIELSRYGSNDNEDEFEVACTLCQAAHDRIQIDKGTWTLTVKA